jgi:hypothetical protein
VAGGAPGAENPQRPKIEHPAKVAPRRVSYRFLFGLNLFPHRPLNIYAPLTPGATKKVALLVWHGNVTRRGLVRNATKD